MPTQTWARSPVGHAGLALIAAAAIALALCWYVAELSFDRR